VTVGQGVRAVLPDGTALEGTASTVDVDGRLVITRPDGEARPIAAADVIHVRPQEAKLDGRH
jgi:BirA family biotin operon repressor/biotin-[acetyl-CoA-carboxylase] ligase